MLATLDRTDELVVLCGLDVPTLKNVRLSLQTLEQLSFPASRIRYVMNRSSSHVGLKTREVEDALKVKVAHELPLDRSVQVSVNRGEPTVLVHKRSDFSKAFAPIVKQLVPKSPSEKPGKARRRRLVAKAA
jgi:pilus assembly protein CpaE